MYKIIGGDGKEYGPVSTEQLRQWIREGRANAATMIQAEGQTEWRALGTFAEFRDVLPAGAPASATAPPGAVGVLPDADAVATAVLAQEYQIEIGVCISRGWITLKENLGLLIGGTVLIMVIQVALAILPFIGGIAQLILTGALTGGIYWLYLRCMRGEDATLSDIFAGFQRGFVNLMLSHIVVSLLLGLCLVPVLLAAIPLIISFVQAAGAGHSSPPDLRSLSVALPLAVGILISLPLLVYFSVAWIFTIPLVIDKQIPFWPAMNLSRRMVNKHWWGVFALLLVAGLIAAAGVLACGVGLLFTIPLGIATLMAAYEDIFCAPPAPAP